MMGISQCLFCFYLLLLLLGVSIAVVGIAPNIATKVYSIVARINKAIDTQAIRMKAIATHYDHDVGKLTSEAARHNSFGLRFRWDQITALSLARRSNFTNIIDNQLVRRGLLYRRQITN
jgi:hypothetical protein